MVMDSVLINRRSVMAGGLAGLALAGLHRRAFASGADSYRNEVRGYGPLQPDPAGLLDLPEGFSYRVISRSGDRMSDGLIVPAAPDGMGCFDLGGNRVALVRNHELKPGAERKGAFAGGTVKGARVYEQGESGEPMPGGTTDRKSTRLNSSH